MSEAEYRDFDRYQYIAAQTAIYPGRGDTLGLMYCGLKLAGESGEIAEKIGKAVRDDEGVITIERRELLAKEIGDVLWYLAEIATHLSFDLSDIVAMNNRKLQDRVARGTLRGSGDNR